METIPNTEIKNRTGVYYEPEKERYEFWFVISGGIDQPAPGQSWYIHNQTLVGFVPKKVIDSEDVLEAWSKSMKTMILDHLGEAPFGFEYK